jgi:hypothetical protein
MSRVLKAVARQLLGHAALAGIVYDDDEIAFDPDQELQGAVRTVTGRRRIGQERGIAQVASEALPMHRCA